MMVDMRIWVCPMCREKYDVDRENAELNLERSEKDPAEYKPVLYCSVCYHREPLTRQSLRNLVRKKE